MKPLTISELELLAEDLRTFVGSQAQKVSGTQNEFGLGFWKMGRLHWVWMVLDKKLPALFLLDSPPLHKKTTTPLLLFLNAHINEKTLKDVVFEKRFGRVLKLEFSSGEIEVRLFPHGLNCIVKSGKSQVAWTKIQELSETPQNESANAADEIVRTPREFHQEWLNTVKSKKENKNTPVVDVEVWRQKEKTRLEKSLQKLDADVQAKKNKMWRQVGEWIKENQSLNAAESFHEYIDTEKSVSWNMQNCFTKAKDSDEKIARSETRRQEILAAMVALPAQTPKELSLIHI